MFKELRISLMVSVVLAAANAVRIMLVYHDVQMALVVGLSPDCDCHYLKADRVCTAASCRKDTP